MFGNLDINDKQWKMSTIGESAKVPLHYGSTASAVNYDSETRYVRITDIGSDGKLNDDFKSPSTYDSSYLLNKGDILFARSGSVGVTYLFDEDYKSIFAGYLIRFIPDDEKLDPEFTYQFTRSSYCQGILVGSKRGGVQKNVNAKQLSAIPIPLPPMDLQKEFVDFVHQVDKSKVIKESVKSRFTEMFGTPTGNEKQWPTETMKSVAPAIQSNNKPRSEGNWLLNLDAIQSNSGEVLFKNRVPKSEVNGSIMAFSPDHVLYSKLRPYLNKVAVPDEYGFGTTELIPLLPDRTKLTRTYLAHLLRSDAFVSKFSSAVAGTKMPRVTMDVFWKFNVPLPPISLQEKFASFVEQVDKSKVGAPSTILLINIYINTEA